MVSQYFKHFLGMLFNFTIYVEKKDQHRTSRGLYRTVYLHADSIFSNIACVLIIKQSFVVTMNV